MEKPRSLFRKVIGHKMLFVAFLLFPTDILAEEQTTTTVASLFDATKPSTPSQQPAVSFNATPPVSKQELQSPTAVNAAVPNNTSSPGKVTVSTKDAAGNLSISTSPFPAASKTTGEISTTSVTSLFNATKPSTPSQQPAVSFKAPPPVSKQELQSSTAVSVPENTSSPGKVTVSVKEKDPRTETSLKLKSQKAVFNNATVNTTVKPHSSTKDVGTTSQGNTFGQSSRAITYPETTKSTEPKEDRKAAIPPDQAVTELSQSPVTGVHYTTGPLTTSVGFISSTATHGTPDTSSQGKKHPIIILAIVFGIVLLIGLIVFLYLRRRRHSGSTSFNSPEWAGQATLPDDTGLDKDVEQQAGSVGEGETRRGTLVTFFGKRQSRVPSIAMEDVNGKGGKAEREQLLSGKAEVGSPSEAIGDANGKVQAPLTGSSPESPAS